jgi:Holliday junction resolvase
MKGGKGARIKGSTFEREIVNYLKACDIPSHRIPLSGAVTGYKGDLRVTVGGLERKAECKRRARAFLTLEKWLDDNAFLFCRDDRSDTLVVMRLSEFVVLARAVNNA